MRLSIFGRFVFLESAISIRFVWDFSEIWICGLYGELENHRYDDTYGILQYIIMDYKCEESLKTKYCAKLTAAGFVDEDGYGIYKKTTTEYKLAAIISYGGGTLALSLSAEPIQ